jgi:GGDEF domain-containing protein
MSAIGTESVVALDVSTLTIIAAPVTALLGFFLLMAWMQDRVRALAWWGSAYLLGGFSVAIWSVEHAIVPPLPPGIAKALLFLACGMIWTAARVFHGRVVLWGAQSVGAFVWLLASSFPSFTAWSAGRVTLACVIIAAYSFLTAAELWRERRRALIRRWPAIFVPLLHGAIFLFPIPLSGLLPENSGMLTLASGWVAIIALEMILYAVGTAFLVMMMAQERTMRVHKDAASTDVLTGLLNRRGFVDASAAVIARAQAEVTPVTVLIFDLDHFKGINDRFGHAVGDAALRTFADAFRTHMREGDVLGRFGGEEFVAILPSTVEEGVTAADRVRVAAIRRC